MNGPSRNARLLLAVLILISLALVTVDARTGDGSPFASLRTGAATLFGPPLRGLGTLVRPVGGFLAGLSPDSANTGDTAAVRARNAELERQVRDLQRQAQRGQELDRLLGLTARGQYRTVLARISGYGGTLGFERTAVIDAGSRDGLRPDLTVVDSDGLVGRVVTVTPFTATVLLATDPQSSVGVRVEATDQIGTVTGTGGSTLRLQLLSTDGALAAGDRLVTLGGLGSSQSPFVPEVPVGEVVSVAPGPGPKQAAVRPFVDFGALGLVGVVIEAPREIPRDSVLPPRPASPAAAPPVTP